MQALTHLIKFIVRLIVLWLVDTFSLYITSLLLPGINLVGETTLERLIVAAAASLVLSIVNLLIRPLVLLLALPFGFFVMFGVGFLVNAVVILITAYLLPSFEVSGFISAVIGGIVLSGINTIITGAMTIDDEDSFYQGIVGRMAARQKFTDSGKPGLGLVMLEIDGLSYHHAKKAIDEGWMPTLKEMMDDEGYVLSRVDCGLPSQTSACQSGIMFGDNYDIPSFRWVDKEKNKLYVSSKDSAELNARYAHGAGLMRSGSSINNMMDGDAEKSLLTLANVRAGSEDEKKRRTRDIYLLMLNPYFFTRVLAYFFWDAIREVWEYWADVRHDVQPRLNRLHHFYPFMRAATTAVMRDLAGYLAVLDIIRGTPALYLTWPGYDEVAHHSGPWSEHAFRTLKQFDKIIWHVRDFIQRKGPRPYELVVLSDHGQSFGATFLQRYGRDLKDFILEHMPEGTQAAASMGGDNGTIAVSAMAGEMESMQQSGMTGKLGTPVARQTQKLMERGVKESEKEQATDTANVTVCGSGNIAQVYFDIKPTKLTLNEMNAAFPGVVEAVVQQEGVGFVVTYNDDVTPIVLGKGGQRNLHTGEVTGSDPLLPYGNVELRAEQVRRIADYPHAGDLIVNSTLFADGTVAAMEELIGNHGGMGGEQTDAFLFHPGSYPVPETKNSADVYKILNARRDLPPPPPAEKKAARGESAEPWTVYNLLKGLSMVTVWLPRMVRAMVFDRTAYREVVKDAYMTGPAILIAIVAFLLAGLLPGQYESRMYIGSTFVSFLLATFFVTAAARALGGKGSFTSTLRAAGFAHSFYLVELLALIPPLMPIARPLALFLVLISYWIGVDEAHDLSGWRTIILPIIILIVIILSIILVGVLFLGTAYTIQNVLGTLGIVPQ